MESYTLANYGVKFNNSGSVIVPLWHSGSGVFSLRVPFKTGSLSATDGLIGRSELSTPVSYIALYADGKYVVRVNSVTVYISATGLLATNTDYHVEIGRTGGTDCYVKLFASDGITEIDSSTYSTAGSFSFNSIGSVGVGPLAFDGVVRQVIAVGGTEDRNYLSSVNTGTVWTETINAQDGTT